MTSAEVNRIATKKVNVQGWSIADTSRYLQITDNELRGVLGMPVKARGIAATEPAVGRKEAPTSKPTTKAGVMSRFTKGKKKIT